MLQGSATLYIQDDPDFAVLSIQCHAGGDAVPHQAGGAGAEAEALHADGESGSIDGSANSEGTFSLGTQCHHNNNYCLSGSGFLAGLHSDLN